MKQDKPITPKQALIAAHIEYLRKKSTMPDIELASIARKKPRNLSKTNGITSAIVDYVTYTGGYANRINTAGRKIKRGGKEIYIKGTTKRGTPDIDIVYAGIPIKVEVKNENTKDKMSDTQKTQREKLEAAGAIFIIAESFESFYFKYEEIRSTVKNNRA